MALWLRYKNGGLTLSRRLETISHLPSATDATREQGETLRGYRYDHLLWRHRTHQITIGANVLYSATLDTNGLTALEFMDGFWEAEQRFLSLATGETEPGDFVAVRTDGGVSPREYVEGHKLLPSYTLTITEKEPI